MKNLNVMRFSLILMCAATVMTSCGSLYQVTDSLAYGNNENTGVLQLSGDMVLKTKVNGVEVVKGKKPSAIILPTGKNECELVFLVSPKGFLRSLSLGFKHYTIVGKIQLVLC